jgi:hypothetical protein
VFTGAEKLKASAVADVSNPPNPPIAASVASAVLEEPKGAPKLKVMLGEPQEPGTKAMLLRDD